MTEPSHDKEFTAFLAGKSDLADRYAELGHEEPPAELDARILAEARAVAKIHQAEFGSRGGWFKPVALAATVLLSFSLVMRIVVESPVRFEQVVTESTRTDVRLEAELPVKKLPAVEALESVSSLSPMTADKDLVLEEGMRLMEMSVTARRIDRDDGLLIVAEYVAAADMSTVSGLVAAPEMESNFARKVERSQPMMTDSVAMRSGRVSDNDAGDGPGDDAGDESGDNPEALLRDIERLRASGESSAAITRLDEFLERYPDHPVSIKIRQQEN